MPSDDGSSGQLRSAKIAGRERHVHGLEIVRAGPEETSPEAPDGRITVVTCRQSAEPEESDTPLPLAAVTYAGVPIAEGAVDAGGLRVSFPFAGGDLNLDRFEGSTYVAAGDVVPTLTTVVTVRQPRLSDLERRAADRVATEVGAVDLLRLDVGTGVERLIELRTELLLAGRPP